MSIVDLSSDPALAGAAGAGARRYLPITDPADLAGLDHVAGSVGLIVLRWPSPTLAPPPAVGETDASSVGDLFTACRLLLATEGCTVVVPTPTPPGAPYVEHAQLIIPAAARAGLGYLQHIVAVTTPLDRLTHPHLQDGAAGHGTPTPAPPAHGTTTSTGTTAGTGASPSDPGADESVARVGHVDLLVFVLRGGRHA